jgi:hypothetical protein
MRQLDKYTGTNEKARVCGLWNFGRELLRGSRLRPSGGFYPIRSGAALDAWSHPSGANSVGQALKQSQTAQVGQGWGARHFVS